MIRKIHSTLYTQKVTKSGAIYRNQMKKGRFGVQKGTLKMLRLMLVLEDHSKFNILFLKLVFLSFRRLMHCCQA